MTNRLNKIFQNLKDKNEKALITFSVSGYPNEETSLEICKAVSDGGAHIHEINIPAEEAQADGPIIQLANIESIKKGITLDKTINMASQLRAYNPELGICLMGYLNNIFIYGIKVDNFKMIKKGYMTNLAIGACSHLIKENKQFEQRIQSLEDQIKFVEMNQGLNNTIVNLQNQIDNIKKRLHI